jgi:hypothetical protein
LLTSRCDVSIRRTLRSCTWWVLSILSEMRRLSPTSWRKRISIQWWISKAIWEYGFTYLFACRIHLLTARKFWEREHIIQSRISEWSTTL